MGTSMDDITKATHLHKQSLYHAFGDKKSLFLKTLGFYYQEVMTRVGEIFSRQGEAPEHLQKMFDFFLGRSDVESCPNGCFVINTISEFGQSDYNIKFALDQMEDEFEKILRNVVITGQKEKTLTDKMKAEEIVDLLRSVLCGALILRRKGNSVQNTRKITRQAVRSICR